MVSWLRITITKFSLNTKWSRIQIADQICHLFLIWIPVHINVLKMKNLTLIIEFWLRIVDSLVSVNYDMTNKLEQKTNSFFEMYPAKWLLFYCLLRRPYINHLFFNCYFLNILKNIIFSEICDCYLDF